MKLVFKTSHALLTLLLFYAGIAFAQSPFQFNFQAVARNLAGNPLTNQPVDFRLSVLQGAMDGTAVYIEEQPATTNNFGIANLLVGSGSATLGSLAGVDWSTGPYFLQIELDIQNGEGYQLMGVSALASVPYALHAKTTEQAGPVGPTGPQGEPGVPGASAYETWLSQGNEGTETDFLNALVGPQGEPGPEGNGGSAAQGIRIGFSESTTWTCPEGVTQITIELWGGAGGSGSSSGFRLFSPGTSCFVGADASPCSPTIQGAGARGGKGGNGGYFRTSIDVIPGEVYSISVGSGGAGGAGGFGVGVNEGTSGQNGFSTSFIYNGTELATAEGGQGGSAGIVNCCNWPTQTECAGWTSGANGANGTQLNYIEPTSTPSERTYIPTEYMTPVSGCCAQGGSNTHQNIQSSGLSNHSGYGGTFVGACNSGGSCINISNCGGDDVEVSPYPGVSGEAGFIVIAY